MSSCRDLNTGAPLPGGWKPSHSLARGRSTRSSRNRRAIHDGAHVVVRATRDLVVTNARLVGFVLSEQIGPGNLQGNVVTWRPPCPKCATSASAVRIILYGMPDKPSDPKRYIEGGAIVRDKAGHCLNPRFACTECGHLWGRVEGFDAK